MVVAHQRQDLNHLGCPLYNFQKPIRRKGVQLFIENDLLFRKAQCGPDAPGGSSGPLGGTGYDHFRLRIVGQHPLCHDRNIALSALVQGAGKIAQAGVGPARFRVPDQVEVFH